MSEKKMQTVPSQAWLMSMAEAEDSCRSFSVGGLASDLGLLKSESGEAPRVFGRLIEFARRQKSLTVEELAKRANIGLEEIVEIETQASFLPHVRTVFQLASALELPQGRLLELAGLATPRPEINRAAVRFAARSESTAKLSREEKEALDEFVKVLVEASDGG